jgi:hypothetical protein
MALFAVITLSLAVGPLLWLARARVVGLLHLLVAAVAAVTMSGSALLIGPWALLSVYMRPVVVAALVAALLVATYRTTSRKAGTRTASGTPRLARQYAVASVFSVIFANALSGRVAPGETIDLDFPLEPGSYAVIQGGNSVALNPFHRWFPSSKHAIDIVRLNAVGNRARGLAPASLRDYETFDTAVRSPCTGTVERLQDDVTDHEPGPMDWEHPAGNHVVLRCGGVRVVLAHLRRGSIVLSRDEHIYSGRLVGRIGNSGSTREPHLHIAAMSAEGDESTVAGLAVTLGGRYLRMNDVVHSASSHLSSREDR